MDVTPRELRDTDIREGFRGYHRDDVDELLERAASTVEGLSERVRQLTERLQSVEGSAGKSRETEEMLQRTLVLAQKTADEAISEAQERSRTVLEGYEAKARKHRTAGRRERTLATRERGPGPLVASRRAQCRRGGAREVRAGVPHPASQGDRNRARFVGEVQRSARSASEAP